MKDTHKCPCGCERDIPPERLSCPRSWFALPKDIRKAVWRAYREKGAGSPEHTHAIRHATDHMRG